MTGKFLTKKDVASLLRIHVTTVNREISRGNLGIYKFGDRVLISELQLESYLKRCCYDSSRCNSKVM